MVKNITRQAGDEIDITPEMDAAGGRVLQDQCDLIMETAITIARGVFREMTEAQHRKITPSAPLR